MNGGSGGLGAGLSGIGAINPNGTGNTFNSSSGGPFNYTNSGGATGQPLYGANNNQPGVSSTSSMYQRGGGVTPQYQNRDLSPPNSTAQKQNTSFSNSNMMQ